MVALVAGAVLDGIDRAQLFFDVLFDLLTEVLRCDAETGKTQGRGSSLKALSMVAMMSWMLFMGRASAYQI
jgi:hypothetical protein